MIGYDIVYVGCGMSGRRTSLAQILKMSGVEADPLAIRGSFSYDVKWQYEGEVLALSMLISAARSQCYYDDPDAPSLDARVLAEIDLLRDADGIIFVVDAQAARLSANLDELEKLHRDLRARGVDPSAKPTVFQVNKRELVGAVSAERIREEFGMEGAYIESTVLQGTGVSEALNALLERRLLRST